MGKNNHRLNFKEPAVARKLQGKALRKNCPRSSQGQVILGQGERDPLVLLENSDQGRSPKLLPIRFTRMVESPLAFFRGSAILQAHDLKGTPSARLAVQCCGDCHLLNFGGFATPERFQIFDINDFDETFPGPFEWDIKRLAASFVLAARWLGFSAADVRQAVLTVLAAYRAAMAGFAQMTILETWYAHIAAADMFKELSEDPKMLKQVKKEADKAAQQTALHVFQKITTTVDGQPRIVDHTPLLSHPAPDELSIERDLLPFFERYRETLSKDRQFLFDRFRLADAAYKVVGIGSVGTRCFIVLFMDERDNPQFLQVKEARPSVFEGLAGPARVANNGERVVLGQRLMQSASDIFLGWARGPEERDFYVRQLRDMKFGPNLVGYTPRMLGLLANLCGRTLARAHAKSGDAAAIAGYLGDSGAFEEAIACYALAYSDQVERDYEIFRAAVKIGRFPVESLPSDLEQAIR